MAVQPWYSVYRAGELSTRVYRAVRTNPAQPGDFYSYADQGASFPWWRSHLANGISAWEDLDTADALAARGNFPFLAEIDLALVDNKLPWARVGRPGHVTIWGIPPLLLQGITSYIPVT